MQTHLKMRICKWFVFDTVRKCCTVNEMIEFFNPRRTYVCVPSPYCERNEL